MNYNELFPEGFGIENGAFKITMASGEITQLVDYQRALIDLIQGYTIYSNESVSGDPQFSGWTTQAPTPIYYGLELLKSLMLSAEQLDEFQDYRMEKAKELKAKV